MHRVDDPADRWHDPVPPGSRLRSLPLTDGVVSGQASVLSAAHVNAVGTNVMDFPEFLRANRAEDPEGRARVEVQVPIRRLGTLDEFAAFCMAVLDGTSRSMTGQFVAFAGGWA